MYQTGAPKLSSPRDKPLRPAIFRHLDKLRRYLASTPALRWGRTLVAIAIALQVILVGGRLYDDPGEPAGDDISIHMAEATAIARALHGGDFDLFTPAANAGYPSAYYYQFGPQLFLALLYLLLGGVVSLIALTKFTLVLGLALLPAATYRALRVVGFAPVAAGVAGLAASLSFGASKWGGGIDSLFITGLYTQIFAMAAFPLAAAYGYRYLRTGQHLRRAVIYTLIVGYCHPFVAFAIPVLLLCWPFWREQLLPLLRRAGALLSLVLLGAAPLVVPILVDYDSFGGFPARLTDEGGVAIFEFARTLVTGDYLDYGRLPVLTVLAVFAPLVCYARRDGRALSLLCGAAVFATAVVLGPVVGKTADDLLPAVRFLAPMQLCLAALAGVTLVHAIDLARQHADRIDSRARARIAVAGVWLGGAAVAFVLTASAIDRTGEIVRTIEDYDRTDRAEFGAVVDFLASQPHARIHSASSLGTGSHWWSYLPYAYADKPAIVAYGGAALQSSANFVFTREFDLARDADLYGVGYVLRRTSRRLPEGVVGAPVLATEHYQVLRLPGASLWSAIGIDRAVDVPRDQRIAQSLAWLRKRAPRTREHIVFGADPGPVAPRAATSIAAAFHEPSRFGATVKVGGELPALVCLAVTYHPRFRARVGGSPAAVVRVSPDLLAVRVPPGEHEVVFEFERPWWSFALYVALLLGLLADRIALGVRRRRTRDSR